MSDRPILFSGPMVRALLAGTKSQTRRVVPEKTQDAYYEYDDWCKNVSTGVPSSRQWEREFFLERSRIQTGDRLWVREAIDKVSEPGQVFYRADFTGDARGLGWRPSIHMPRWASRLTLTVTEIRVQRLQDISEEDAIAEGVERLHQGWFPYGITTWMTTVVDGREVPAQFCRTAKQSYSMLWDHINGRGAWAANPFVVALTFTVEQRNIDAPPAPGEQP